ncbi:hypothetical protein CDAR_78381 [Caerostris darwini]|uniref:Uncharacterized protein n=1 Tax=Caerostris darwini TaxID=1538125 RepID=A0AAV4SB44_9ARAC|nr:hypothetical protein CDAR_78381 [Caerostris darwini]
MMKPIQMGKPPRIKMHRSATLPLTLKTPLATTSIRLVILREKSPFARTNGSIEGVKRPMIGRRRQQSEAFAQRSQRKGAKTKKPSIRITATACQPDPNLGKGAVIYGG